ncbi:MAG: SUMF1/EgtB/PvdO family nonheme iron enzyme [Treponema sp.]|nr:SUMF1/EgtB/PvdO family nonheme iron enzyme [Treponema sp.]
MLSLNRYSSNSGAATHPVGEKTANSLGLFDIGGNVFELCWDWYGSVDGNTPATGPESDVSRVIRGGSWYDNASVCVVAFRSYRTPGYRFNRIGFRLVARP